MRIDPADFDHDRAAAGRSRLADRTCHPSTSVVDAKALPGSSAILWHPVIWQGVFFFLTLTGITSPADAAGSGMPWEAPLESILESIEGPVAKIIAVIIIVITGLTLAFGDTSGGFRRLIQIVFGLSIAFAASSFFLTFFSFGGGALV